MRATSRLTLAAAALVAGLALTACGQGADDKAATPSASTAPAPRSTGSATPSARPAAPSVTARPTTARPAGTTRPATGAPAPSRSGDPVSTPCTGATTKVIASKVSRPVNHLLLTVTNTGTQACNAYGAPFVGFDDAQSPIRILDESKPQAVVTLAPGESAYASVLLTGEGGADSHGRTVRRISVHFAPGDGSGGSVGSGRTVAAPSGTYADDGAAVSYWQRNADEALTF
ncbi:DUF4232 domain-containing protein [Streptomyces sp. NPDC085614]|uniref:DUF4232 domain-containing protein n=1 Tax=Streptomyces sp. NPDC085614 TaxID=3365733 RepID=UPI0037D11F54